MNFGIFIYRVLYKNKLPPLGYKVNKILTQSRTLQAFPGTEPLPLVSPASCLQKNFNLLGLPQVPKSKFSQRSEKIQKQRKVVKQEKNNNSLVIRQSQGSLFPPQGRQIISRALSLSCFADTKTLTMLQELTAC